MTTKTNTLVTPNQAGLTSIRRGSLFPRVDCRGLRTLRRGGG